MNLREALDNLATLQQAGGQAGAGVPTLGDILEMASQGRQARLGQQQEQRLATGQQQQYGLGVAGLGLESGRLGVSQQEQALRERAFEREGNLTDAEFQRAVADYYQVLLAEPQKMSASERLDAAIEFVQRTQAARAGGGKPLFPKAIPVPGSQAAQGYVGSVPSERRKPEERLFGRVGQGPPGGRTQVGLGWPPGAGWR